MKSTLKITSKGQVTFRKKILDQLGVRPGDRVTLEIVGRQRLEMSPTERASKLDDFVDCLKKATGRPPSIEAMNKIARKAWSGDE